MVRTLKLIVLLEPKIKQKREKYIQKTKNNVVISHQFSCTQKIQTSSAWAYQQELLLHPHPGHYPLNQDLNRRYMTVPLKDADHVEQLSVPHVVTSLHDSKL